MSLQVRTELAPRITEVHTGTVATGIAGVMGNKGACGLSMTFVDSTSVAFISSHLAARAERVKQRNDDFR